MSEEVTSNPVEEYVQTQGDYCARTVITRTQLVVLVLLVCCAVAACCIYPLLSFYIGLLSASALSLLILSTRMLVYLCGAPRHKNLATSLPADDELPIYSVLVPLYKEPQVIPTLLKSLMEMDYPQDLLDIQLLVEEHDALTQSAIGEHELPACMRMTVVETGKPQTKPRACDYGLALARGEFVVIFDAEDRPEPDQLKKAVAEFKQLPENYACLQARLSHYNCASGLTARWTDLDYTLWYGVSMNGLQRLGVPMPLGGTSNHFKIESLRAVGGWDPFNVTEDCDLGLRLIRQKKRTRMLDSVTWEEAVTGVGAWIKQRSRWIKGFMQTALVHTRWRSLRAFGLYKYMGMLFFVPGSVLMQLGAPALFIAPLLLLLQTPDEVNRFQGSMIEFMQTHTFLEMLQHNEFMSAVLFVLGLIGMIIGIFVVFLHGALALMRGRRDLALTALSIPAAWLCLACAAWRALAELIIKPFYWAKTKHGETTADKPAASLRSSLRSLFVMAGIAVAVYAFSAYLIRLDLIVHTWGQERHAPFQVPSQLQKVGIKDSMRCSVKRLESEVVPTWVLQKDPSVAWSDVAGISALAFIDVDHGQSRQLQWELRLDDGYWFTCLDAEPIIPGRWTRLEFDLRAYASTMKAKDHKRAWDDYAYQDIEEIRLVDYTPAQVATVSALNLQSVLSVETVKPQADALQFTFSKHAQQNQAAFSLLEWDFTLSKTFENPYDADVVALDAVFTHAESGKQIRQPAFFKIPYQRSQKKMREELRPNGAATWSVRWAAPTAGTWSGAVELREAGALTQTHALAAVVVTSAEHPGYIQRHKSKPYLHHSNGDFFYPIGHNICWPIDTKQPFKYEFELPEDSGTYAYDQYFKKMGDAKENWGRIWMAYTWIGLEGLDTWRHFDGLGQYNQANASRLDHLMAEARKNGVYIRLTMQHYSDFSEKWGNTNWNTNPYNQKFGGPLRYSGEFLFNERAMKLQKRRLRYIIARWGWDPYVESWELWGEVNLLDGFNQRLASRWHTEMIEHIASLDATDRPVFSHCHNWQLGMRLWATEGLDCVQGNGYIRPPNHTPNHVRNFTNYVNEVKHFDKPIFMAEYGGRSELGAPSEDYLEAQLHSGLWAGAMQPFAGSPFSWWWNFIDGENMYFHYTPLADFLTGIDRIKRDLKKVTPLTHVKSGSLLATGMQDAQGGIYWIYQPRCFVTCKLPSIKDAEIALSNLSDGTYRLRVLDTWTGVYAQDEEVSVKDGTLRVALPQVDKDIALRLDRVENN